MPGKVVGPEDEPVSDAVINFVLKHGQSLDWLHRGDATPIIRMLRRRFEALEAVRGDVDKAAD